MPTSHRKPACNPLRTLAFALACGLLGPGASARAANLGAFVQPFRFNCAAFGDPHCAGGQVQDPSMNQVSHVISNASGGALAVADKTWFDPRIGTANFTSGTAQASLGMLRTTSAATVSSSPPLGSGSPNLMRLGSFSTARFIDELTIVPADPALVGQLGTFTASIAVDGFLDVSGVNGTASPSTMASADWRIAVTIEAPSPVGFRFFGSTSSFVDGFHGYRIVNADGSLVSSGLGASGIVTFTTPIVLGMPFTLNVSFVTNSSGVLSAAVTSPLTSGLTLASSQSLYNHTAVWNGMSNVRVGGQTLTDFSAPSPSGIDYRYRPDIDADGVSDDADVCPYFTEADQSDSDANGRGDACECGDQNGDGSVNVIDLVAINAAIFSPALATPLCDANGDTACDVSDIVAANVEIFSPTSTATCTRQPYPGP